MSVRPDYNTVQKALKWLISKDRICEVRTIEQYRGRSQVGYFNDTDIACNAIVNGDNDGLTGIYATLNPVAPELFARVSNHMVSAGAGNFTKDNEIVERRQLLLDFDPKRFTGISSTAEEHQQALDRMQEVSADMTTFHGFPVPCLIDSGNGGHIKYMLEAMANDPDSTNLVRTFLQCMDQRYGDGRVEIDKTVFNASRIARIPGTPARKGEDNIERPHRVSRILQDFDPFDLLSRTALERFVARYADKIPEKLRKGLKDPLRAIREYPPDENAYRALNRIARDRFHEWVMVLLGDLAHVSGEGYRIQSDRLGRDLEEAIWIGPTGIKDFGVADQGDATEGRRTAISLLTELLGTTKRQSAEILSQTLNCKITEFDGKLIMPPLEALKLPEGMPEALLGAPGFAMPKNGGDFDVLSLDRTEWLIKNFIIDRGYTIVSAPTKMGKSTLTKQLLACCLTGADMLGSPVEKCEVLYVAYEDMAAEVLRDMRHILWLTLKEMGHDDIEIPFLIREALKGFHYYARELNEVGEFFHQVPTGRAGIDFIIDLTSNKLPNVRVTCVDPIRLLSDETIRSRNVVTQQYHEGLDMLNMAVKGHTAVWGLHHHNKESGKKISEGVDPLLSAGGTAAMTGAAQNIIVFEGDRVPEGIDGATGLYIAPRISQAKQLIVKFHNQRFYLAPPDTEIYYKRNQPKTEDPNVDVKIIAFLDQHHAAPSPVISEGLNIPKYTIDRRLTVLKQKGIVDVASDEGKLHYKGKGGPARIWFLTKAIKLPELS